MRWLFWTGGVVALAGMVWLLRQTSPGAGTSTGSAVAAILLFLGGLVLAGVGMWSDVGDG